jgi:hypothetical protein
VIKPRAVSTSESCWSNVLSKPMGVWNTYGQKTDDRMVTNASATKRNAKIGANVATTL